MLKFLGLGMLLLVACSSESGLFSSNAGEGGDGSSGSSGAASAQAGAHAGASVGAHAGAGALAGGTGGAGGAETTTPAGGAGAAGESTEEGGAAGALGSAGAGGAAGHAGAVSLSGAGGGGSGNGGGSGSAGQAGSATAGAGGTLSLPDPCEGKKHWASTERWTDYAQGDQRVFGGVLWHCQSPWDCTAYPGHSSSPGWFKDVDCKGGPTSEVAACQCAAGQCCDGCYVRPRSYFCGEVVRTAQCAGPVVNQCGGATDTIDKDWWNLFCDGAESTTCSRWGAHKKFSNGDCPAGTGCIETSDQASCVACN